MNKLFSLISLLLWSILGKCQNLVPNPSFENITSCPTTDAQLFLAFPWVMPSDVTGTSDIFNACNTSTQGVPSNITGYQNARTGFGYAGFYTYGLDIREYLQVQLTAPLAAGGVYKVEMYVNPSEAAGVATDAFGIYLSNIAIVGSNNYFTLPFVPQITNAANNIITDTLAWTLISGFYTASGGENYITLGSFVNDFNTNINNFNLSGWGRGYYHVDDVSVSLVTSVNDPDESEVIKIYPNPFSTTTTLQTDQIFNNATLTVHNSFGQLVKQLNNVSGQSVDLARDNLGSGLYFIRLTEKNKIIEAGRVVISD